MRTPNRPDPARVVVSARPSPLVRARLSEPARFYAYGTLLLLLIVLTAVGAVTGEWSAVITGQVAAALGLIPAAEATRASVYPEKHVLGLLVARRPPSGPELAPGDVMLGTRR